MSQITNRIMSIAASADGRETWAVGPQAAGGRLTLYRFDGLGWRSCDPQAGAAQSTHSACADLAPLAARGLLLESIATVSSDGEAFEAVAVGWLPAPPGSPEADITAVIVRYRDGRWTVEATPTDPTVGRRYRLRAVAFAERNDGWAYGASAWDSDDPVILRFEDGHWISCSTSGTCDAGGALPDQRFAAPTYGPALVAAGDGVFLAGTRIVPNKPLPHRYYPVVLARDGERWGTTDSLDPAAPGRSPTPGDEAKLTSFAVTAKGDGGSDGWARLGPPDGTRSTTTLRLQPDGQWRPWSPSQTDALASRTSGSEIRGAATSGSSGAQPVMTTDKGPLLRFDAEEDRWRVLPAPFDPSGDNPFTAADVHAVGPDGRGGLWLVQDGGANGPYFHRYADRVHRPVFDDVGHPFVGGRLRALAAGPAGTVWLARDGGQLARYDRLTGWSRVDVEGWDRGSAGPTPVSAIAVGAGGRGVAVGDRGQIADFGPRGARLDTTVRPPLRAVDVALDGSAMVGGDSATLLWSPRPGDFHSIRPPPAGAGAKITAVALPAPDRAWVATAGGEVFAGRRTGDTWTWGDAPENVGDGGKLLAGPRALRAIALDARGHGYAVGDGGTVLERTDGAWRRLELGVSDDFTAVALSDEEVLIGAAAGAIWTRVGGAFQLARPGSVIDGYTALGGARISGLALLPGDDAGDVEAWAALDGGLSTSALLHYASDPGDPLLTPAGRAPPLPDAPAPRPGELSFVAFGKSDCANPSNEQCPGPSGTDALNDIVSRRLSERIAALRREPNPLAFAVFTGDANDHGGNLARGSRPVLLNEWVDLVVRPIEEASVPVMGAIGVLDLAEATPCWQRSAGVCLSTDHTARAGANIFWRQAMARRVGQDGGRQEFGGLHYRPVRDELAPSTPDVKLPASGPDPAPSSVPTGGARTHYAVDVLRGQEALVRLVFVDNSLGSLRASDPLQQPPEPRGQLAWLDRVLGSRPKGARAVVVSTSPSYSYRPETVANSADDGAIFEEVVLKHGVSAVVSGRLGWNALYYTLAPGLHCPAPGGSHPEHAPTSARGCGRSAALPAGAPALGDHELHGAVPFVVSSSAGGKLAQESGEGYWHGYSVIRLDAPGDPAKTIVEQRPILDWVVVTASARRLKPGRRLTLKGVGREPPAADTPPRYHRIDSPAITHRYDLLLADPDKPWLPLRDDQGDYVPVTQRHPGCEVGCVDRQTGEVRAGEGADERVYAVALLSVGELSATYPLVFDPRSARKALAAVDGSPAAPGVAPAAGRPAANPSSPTTGAPTAPGSPSATLELPTFPTFPPAAPPQPPQAPGPPTPASPNAPPPHVAGSASQAAQAASSALEAPRVAPVPPGAPHAKPSPKVTPGIEAAVPLQAAVAAIDDDPLDAAAATADPREDLLVDIAPAPSMPPGAATTRRAHERPEMQMTALDSADQPSAWTRNAGYGGGLTLAAMVLAGGWLAVRSRRRAAGAPAPAYNPHRRR